MPLLFANTRQLITYCTDKNTQYGIININNYSSVANFINHFGGVFTEFEADFKDYGPRLFYTIPLDEQTPYRQLDLENIHHFLINR